MQQTVRQQDPPPQTVTRKAKTSEALGTGDHETPLSICDFVRTVKTRTLMINIPYTSNADRVSFSDFDAVNPDAIRQLSKKQEETQRSLEKIEKGGHLPSPATAVHSC